MESTFFVRQLHSMRESKAINGPKLREGSWKGKFVRADARAAYSRNSARHQPAAVCARSRNENVPCSLSLTNSFSGGCCGWVDRGSQVTPAVAASILAEWPLAACSGTDGMSDECGARVLWAFYERFRWRAGRVIIKYYHTYVRGTSLSIYGLCCLRLRALTLPGASWDIHAACGEGVSPFQYLCVCGSEFYDILSEHSSGLNFHSYAGFFLTWLIISFLRQEIFQSFIKTNLRLHCVAVQNLIFSLG
jgi:hypothetical protein